MGISPITIPIKPTYEGMGMLSNKHLVIMLHGFNVRDGGFGTVERLKPLLIGRADKIVALRYGYFGLLSVYKLNEGVAERLNRLIDLAVHEGYQKVTVIGHSNGCAIMHRAAVSREVKRTNIRYIYINPALRRDAIPPSNILNELHVLYSHEDRAVKMTKFIPKRLRKNWGQMGRAGVFLNIVRATPYIKQYEIQGGHSFMFTAEGLVMYGDIVANIIGEQQWQNWRHTAR